MNIKYYTSVAIIGGVLTFLVIVFGIVKFGSLINFRRVISGSYIFLDQEYLALGSVAPGQQSVEVTMWNFSSGPLLIQGNKSPCGCTTIRHLPIALSAGEAVTLELVVGVPSQPGPFARQIELYTDVSNVSPVLWVTGTVVISDLDGLTPSPDPSFMDLER